MFIHVFFNRLTKVCHSLFFELLIVFLQENMRKMFVPISTLGFIRKHEQWRIDGRRTEHLNPAPRHYLGSSRIYQFVQK